MLFGASNGHFVLKFQQEDSRVYKILLVIHQIFSSFFVLA